MAKITLEFSGKANQKIANFLSNHERDIAICRDDFGDLESLFIAIFDEEPKDMASDRDRDMT